MKYIRIIARVLLGIVFIYSGFVKAVDPTGSAIKFSEYFEAFHLPWLGHIALILAVLQSTIEFSIGVALLLRLRMKLTSAIALIFMVFFTLLTLYSAVYSPVSDCGCFGDALILTNWQTFYKNLILLPVSLFIFLSRRKYEPVTSCKSEWFLMSIFILVVTGLSVYCLRYEPIIDFRPYSIGTYIPAKMIIPKGAPVDQYESVLYYSKNGVTKEFTLQNYPANDSTWKFVDTKSKLIKKGYTPPIHGFTITSADGEDITDKVLAERNFAFLIISPDLDGISEKSWSEVIKIAEYASKRGYSLYFLSGSVPDLNQKATQKYNLTFPFYSTDVTTLKTIVRSNPGLLLLKQGIILNKWSNNDFPAEEQLNKFISTQK
jgi:uncharacterized membrane protein YphA (DoxX/SURF4 family)